MYAEVAARPPDVSSYTHNSLPAPSVSRSPIAGTGTTPVDSTTVNMSAPGPSIQPTRSASLSPASSLPSFDTTISPTPSLVARVDAPSGAVTGVELNTTASAPQQDAEPDAQIVEALRSKDRIYVLKLGEQMEALIKDRRVRIELSPSTSYQRLLVHRCSAYYKLSPEADPVTKSIIVYCRSESRIPSRRICELVPAEQATQPTIQIMRRPRGRQYSQPGSTAGEDADTSDVDASEGGSIGSRSNTASAAAKRPKTIEEREAAYNEARSRIFMDFEEKEKEKEKDMSANSSTFSLVSGSGSTSGGRGSSIGDLDDSASSAPTESEWSGPVARDKRDVRKGAGSATSSSRSLRSSAPSFNNGSNSSRNSRATSPSFTYPTLYDPAVPPVYEQTQYGPQMPPPAGYIPHYGYPQYNPAPPGQPYVGPYYYPPYNYPPPPTQHSDPGTPGGVEYPPLNPPQQPAYPQYMWPNSPPPGQAPVANQYTHQQPGLNAPRPDALPSAHATPPTQNIPQYPPYAPAPPVYGYGMPYYPQPYQPGAPMGPPPALPGPAYPTGPIPESVSGSVGSPNGLDMPNLSRTSSRNSNGHGSMNGRRGAARGRGSWMHGPGGVSNGNYGYGSPPVHVMGGHETFGTRLGVNARRISGTSSSSGSAGARTPADETSSTAVSARSCQPLLPSLVVFPC
ncbi:hypothetical protein BD413DRAFT_569195 [Trametes elegans]|nr:hypothetical protein BD413DRAFT_569195 [Trametes elegans]